MIKSWVKILPYFLVAKLTKKFTSGYYTLENTSGYKIKVKVWHIGKEEGYFISDVSELKATREKVKQQLSEINDLIKKQEVVESVVGDD